MDPRTPDAGRPEPVAAATAAAAAAPSDVLGSLCERDPGTEVDTLADRPKPPPRSGLRGPTDEWPASGADPNGPNKLPASAAPLAAPVAAAAAAAAATSDSGPLPDQDARAPDVRPSPGPAKMPSPPGPGGPAKLVPAWPGPCTLLKSDDTGPLMLCVTRVPGLPVLTRRRPDGGPPVMSGKPSGPPRGEGASANAPEPGPAAFELEFEGPEAAGWSLSFACFLATGGGGPKVPSPLLP